MAKTDALSFRIAPDLKAALGRLAEAEDRSISYLVERILREWMTERGHLPGK